MAEITEGAPQTKPDDQPGYEEMVPLSAWSDDRADPEGEEEQPDFAGAELLDMHYRNLEDANNRIKEPLVGGRMRIEVVRHGQHENGHLTPEGRDEITQQARDLVTKNLDANPGTYFMTMASDTQHFGKEGPGGFRAQETADIYNQVIREELAKRGLPPEQLFEEPDAKDKSANTTPHLAEPDIYVQGGMGYLATKYGGTPLGPYGTYFSGEADDDLQQQFNAETSKELAARTDYEIKMMETVGASFFRDIFSDKKQLVEILVTHGELVRNYLHNVAGVPLDQLEVGTGKGFELRLDPTTNTVVADFKGESYPIRNYDTFEHPNRIP